MKIFITVIICGVVSGCSLPVKTEEGTTYHLIIGIGLIATNTNNKDAVIATRTKALGLSVSDQPGLKFGLGYSSSKTISVKEGAENVVVEIEDNSVGDVTVKIDSAIINNGGLINEN